MSTVPTRTATSARHSEEPVPAGRAVLSWLSALTKVVVAGVLGIAAGLVFWSVVPILAGMQAHVIVSGSMEPSIASGDIVLTEDVDPAAVRPGMVLLFHDPAFPGRLLMHRVTKVNGDGTVVTRGDANRTDDSTAVSMTAAEGIGRLRIPYVGLPMYWRTLGDFPRLGALAVFIALASVFVTRRDDEPSEDDVPTAPPSEPEAAPQGARIAEDVVPRF